MDSMPTSSWAATQPGATIAVPAGLDTPNLVVDLSTLKANLSAMTSFGRDRGIEIAPHFKTHRTPQIARLQLEAGSSTLCIAKLGEAEVLRAEGFTDFVMAYAIVGELKFARAKRLMRSSRLMLSVEDGGVARSLGASMATDGLVADVLIIVDVGFHREGIAPDGVAELAAVIRDEPGLRLRGLLTHEGHAMAAPDDVGLTQLSRDSGELLVKLATELRSVGHHIDVISAGSSGTAIRIGEVEGVSQLRPGIYPFNDLGQVTRGTATLDTCAARVVSTVIAHAAPDRALIDAGSKSLGQDLLSIWTGGGGGDHGLLVDLPGWSLHALSEEHGWLRWTGDGPPTELQIGTQVQILPNHICSVFHVLGESVIVDHGEYVATWKSTARGESR
jgi:D-serine deaminase-like pyridoxal phosphate-dependent protein